MLRNYREELSWLTFGLFSDCKKLVHGVFLRHGGVSKGPYQSLNFGFEIGDPSEGVAANRELACRALGIQKVYHLSQTHSTSLHEAPFEKELVGDGLLTCKQGVGLLIKHADCQAAIFYDPVRHALANVHCGWRGNVANIYQATVERMRSLYGSLPENLLVGISPSLGPDASEFIHYKTDFPPQFHPFQHKPFYFNLWELARWQLQECGILPHHIEIAEICTYSRPEDFFSYRREKQTGRNGTLAALL